jgi:predicted Holliday junction resolvase-like endonuclease
LALNRWRNEERQALETQLRQLANAVARMQIERWKQQHEQEIRYDAVQRSTAVTRGKVTEHIVPYLPGFDLNPKDIRFLGTPIDLIAFKGLNDSMEEIEIVFIEVKTGGSGLSACERAVKKANLALLLQRKGAYGEAADYWRRYLANDRASEWAAPARRSLKFCGIQMNSLTCRPGPQAGSDQAA